MKKQITGFDVRRLVLDFNKLEGSYFDKAYQLSSNELVLRFNIKGEGKAELYINFKGHLYLTTTPKPKPGQPSTFAMVLRKHLGNARVEEISQYEFDRIIVIRMSKHEEFRLILELFGEGNAVLVKKVDDDSEIINSLFQRSWSARTLRPGHPYKFPPETANPFSISKEHMSEIFTNSKRDLIRTLAIDLNLGGLYAEEVCKLVDLEKNIKAKDIDDDKISLIYTKVSGLLERLTENPEPQVIYENSEPVDVVPIKLRIYDSNEKINVSNLSAGLESFFPKKSDIEESTISSAASALEDRKSKLERQLQQQNDAIDKFNKINLKKKMEADLIYQNYQQCEAVLNQINDLRKKYDWDEIIDEELLQIDEVTELNHHEGYVKLKLKSPEDENVEVELQLDFRLNVNQNAERYYEAAKAAREKKKGAETAKLATEESLKDLDESIAESEKQAAKLVEESRLKLSRKIFWFEKYKWLISSDNNIIVAGYDAASNEKVVKRYLRQGDRYVHADLHGAPSAVVRRKDQVEEAIPESTLKEACIFSVLHSKAWGSGLGSASAYWVSADQVSKTPEAGEFLAKGAFVVRGKRNYVSNIELLAAVGEIEYEGVSMLSCGPVPTIKNRTGKYVVIRPGASKKTEIAKKLSKTFKCPVDELMKILPPGDMEIAETIGIEIE